MGGALRPIPQRSSSLAFASYFVAAEGRLTRPRDELTTTRL